MKKNLLEIKEELKNNLSLASTSNLVKYYDIISGTKFSQKIKARFVNENTYLDKKIRLALFQLINECNRVQTALLYKVMLNEEIEIELGKNKKTFQTKLETLVNGIDKDYNLIDYDFNMNNYMVTLDIAETAEHPWMDIMEYIYDNFIDAEDSTWKYMGHSGGVLTLQYIIKESEVEEKQKEETDELKYDSYDEEMSKTKELKDKDIKDPNEQPKEK
jgi:hypothetical protein